MRRSSTIGRNLPYSISLSNATPKQTLLPYSTSSAGGGDGRGRGRGTIPRFDFNAPRAPGQPQPDAVKPDPDESPSSLGRGRGKPLASSPILPSYTSFVSSFKPPSAAGRGAPSDSVPSPPGAEQRPPEEFSDSEPKKPIFFRREEVRDSLQSSVVDGGVSDAGKSRLPENIASMLSGAGRGQIRRQPPGPEIQTKEVNRHIRPPKAQGPATERRAVPKMSPEEARQHALGVLGRDSDGADVGEGGRGGGRGMRGRGGRGRGRGRGRGTGRGRGRYQDSEDENETALFGDSVEAEKMQEKLAEKFGTEVMTKFTDGFEEMGDRVLPSPTDDAYLDALDVNYKDYLAILGSFDNFLIEFEPEYMMGDFENNPDIDEKPPISLRDALEKAKPFLMAYEGIESQEEWEEIMKETMETVPLLKEIVDHYSGPNRVTAKRQQEELERVAKTLPVRAPDSVKQFTDRAVLSLQSNPGWGFDKKCQFMDKLVWQMSQQYK
ncbi:hypothetical protein F8388_020314 [Cannabis sativa]|uniref:Hydroxyproline-rich glycoprotein family protein n=1 Tax=Cannabis sativa TaxID=3483 RepID=A0A7J6FVL4_CANSA|nr:hypothetical protein F8388_020314 [Cannabis sativa]